jgi:DNA invertase Pin-like site-specific DNA recombinase
MSAEDWSPSDLPAVSYVRVAPTDPDEAARQVERQRAQITLAAQRLILRMTGEFIDVGHWGMSMDRPDLRRLLDHIVAHQVGYCVVATLDRLSEDPEHMADIDQALTDAQVAIVIAADHIANWPRSPVRRQA